MKIHARGLLNARLLFFKDSFHNDNQFQTLRPVQFCCSHVEFTAANPTAAGLPARANPLARPGPLETERLPAATFREA